MDEYSQDAQPVFPQSPDQGMDEDLPSWAELDGDFPDWAEMDTLVDPGPAEYPSVVSGQGDNLVASEKADYPVPSQKADHPVPSEKADYPVPSEKADLPVHSRLDDYPQLSDSETVADCPSPSLAPVPVAAEHLAAKALEVTPSTKQAPPSPPSTAEQTATRPEPLEPAISEEPTKQPPAVVNVDSDNKPNSAEPCHKNAYAEPAELVPEATWKARLRRVFKPRRDGSYQVPSEFVDMYKSTEGQDKIFALFQRAQYDSAP